jgi:hypothetical protein
MPTVKSGESEQEFVSRCISTLIKDEGKEQKQAIAICFSMYRRRNEDLIGKLNKLLIKDEISGGTVTGDIEKNTAKGKVDVLGDCPKGQHWCPERKKCIPINGKNESSIVGGSYIDNTTVNILGSGQTRIVGKRDGEIKVLTTKKPDITTKFNKLLGIYIADGKILGKNRKKKRKKKMDRNIKGPHSYGLMFDE